MEKTNECKITSIWKRYDPSDPKQVPEEDGDYFVLVQDSQGVDYVIWVMQYHKDISVLNIGGGLSAYARSDFMEFISNKYKYGAFTEMMMNCMPHYSQNQIIAFRTVPVDSIIDDLVKEFVTKDEFDVALEEAEERLNQ